MKHLIWLGAAAFALTAIGATSANAQRDWSPPQDWGTGWHHWTGHHREARGWGGPAWYNGQGEHHGWYHWNNQWYQHCGYRMRHHHHREWRCY